MVAGNMAAAVVHMLEVIEVDQHYGEFAVALGKLHRKRETLLHRYPVRQAGERIVLRHVAHLLLLFAQLHHQHFTFARFLAQAVIHPVQLRGALPDAALEVALAGASRLEQRGVVREHLGLRYGFFAFGRVDAVGEREREQHDVEREPDVQPVHGEEMRRHKREVAQRAERDEYQQRRPGKQENRAGR